MRFSHVGTLAASASLACIAGCSGEDAGPARPRLSVSSLVQDFGAVPTGSPAAATLTVRNSSSTAMMQAPLILLEGDGGDLTAVSKCTHALGVGETCDVILTYAPVAKTAREAALVIFDDGADGVTLDAWTRLGHPSRAARPVDLVIPVRGQGDRRDRLTVSPDSLTWAMVDGSPETKTVALRSTGVDPVSTAFEEDGASDGDFDIQGCPATLAPGETCTLSITPQPDYAYPVSAKLTWGSATCTLTESLVTPAGVTPVRRLPTPADVTLRAVDGWSFPSLVVGGDDGAVFRRTRSAATTSPQWNRLSAPPGETVLALGTFGDGSLAPQPASSQH